MSDHDALDHSIGPDPMDKAYAQAEAVLSDDAARAARRARVLAAVAGEPAAEPVEAAPAMRRSPWRPGGWLVAASVAGIGVFLATQVYLPTLSPQPATPAPTAPAAPDVAAPPARAASPAARMSGPASGAVSPSPGTATPLRHRPPLEPAPAPSPPPPGPVAKAGAPAADNSLAEIVVTGSRIPSAAPSVGIKPAARASAADSGISELVITAEKRQPAPAAVSPTAGSLADRAARLRAAAAAGRTDEVTALLAARAPIDMPDEAGETALMKAVQADQPAAVALLRRRGASLDRKNHAGASARDMATAMGDAELSRALLAPGP